MVSLTPGISAREQCRKKMRAYSRTGNDVAEPEQTPDENGDDRQQGAKSNPTDKDRRTEAK